MGAKDYGKTLFGQLVKNGDCMLFGTGLSKAELKDTLMIDGECCKEYTIFAPTDDAFGDYCKKNGVTKLEPMNLPEIPDVIKGHVVEGKSPMDQIPEEMTTLAGTTIKAPKVVMNKGLQEEARQLQQHQRVLPHDRRGPGLSVDSDLSYHSLGARVPNPSFQIHFFSRAR